MDVIIHTCVQTDSVCFRPWREKWKDRRKAAYGRLIHSYEE